VKDFAPVARTAVATVMNCWSIVIFGRAMVLLLVVSGVCCSMKLLCHSWPPVSREFGKTFWIP
jgi:hypothetical protein